MNTHPSLEIAARTLGVTPDRVRLELAGAARKKAGAGEVSTVIRGRRVLGKRGPSGDWMATLEALPADITRLAS
jgi:hypothetical protein